MMNGEEGRGKKCRRKKSNCNNGVSVRIEIRLDLSEKRNLLPINISHYDSLVNFENLIITHKKLLKLFLKNYSFIDYQCRFSKRLIVV